jgi:hypothetical protein
MSMSKSPVGSAHDTDADLDARWAEQERMRKAVAAGEDAPVLDQALYAALASQTMPELPADFAANIAKTAERFTDARRCIAGFRALSLRLFGLLYVPVIVLVAVLFASDIPAMWARSTPEQRAPMMWAASLLLLWLAIVVTEIAVADHLRKRSRSPSL